MYKSCFGGKGYILVYTIYQPEATLGPLSSELNNINHIVTLHSYTGEVISWELCGRYVGTCAPLLNIGANQVITHLHTTAAFWDHTRTLTQKQCDPAHCQEWLEEHMTLIWLSIYRMCQSKRNPKKPTSQPQDPIDQLSQCQTPQDTLRASGNFSPFLWT